MNKMLFVFGAIVFAGCFTHKLSRPDIDYLSFLKLNLYNSNGCFCYRFKYEESDTIALDNTARNIEFNDFSNQLCNIDFEASGLKLANIKNCMPGVSEYGKHGMIGNVYLKYFMNIGIDCQGKYDKIEDRCNAVTFIFNSKEYLIDVRCELYRGDVESKSFDLIQERIKYYQSTEYKDSMQNKYKKH